MQFFVNYIVGNIRQWKYKKGVPFLPKMVKKKKNGKGLDLGAEPITIKFFSLLSELYYNIAFVRIHDRTVRLIPDKFSIGSMFG